MVFKKIGLMVDCSRNAVPTVETLKVLIDLMAQMGYNRLELYTEDTYELASRPYFGYLRGRYSGAEIKEIDEYAAVKRIELSPCVQALAHLNQIFRWPCFEHIRDCNDILLIDEPETYVLIEDIFATLAENFTSRHVNIGCDEAWMAGLGSYLEKHGYENRFTIMVRHIERVLEIAQRYGFHCSMWSDMYFHLVFGGYYDIDRDIPPEVLARIPKNVSLIFWDYWHTDIGEYRKIFAGHSRFGNEIKFAGGTWKWTGFAPDNAYALKSTEAALTAAAECGVEDVMITAWGDNGAEASLFSVLPGLFYFSRLATGKSVDAAALDKDFKALTGTGFAAFFDIEAVNDFAWVAPGKKPSAEKYFLYNDYLLGIMDGSVTGRETAHYRAVSDKLKRGKYGKFSYIFKTMGALAAVLEKKAGIGVKTRAAYRKGDKAALKTLADDYAVIAGRISTFYTLFEKQWHKENKPFGFEVQDMRLGGLLKRTQSCRRRLLAYCAGKIASIPELDVEILPFAEPGTGCGYPHLSIISASVT